MITATALANEIERQMLPLLDNLQRKHLHAVLQSLFYGVSCATDKEIDMPTAADNEKYLELFLSAKAVEGCSDRTLSYYETALTAALAALDLPVQRITTDHVRAYLDSYQRKNGAGPVTVDNVRRILSSFFSWLEEEDHIVKSPLRRIHKVRSCKAVKVTFTDEELEQMRDGCGNPRDLALIDLLASTGMRVGELVRLNRSDVNLETRECIVLGKGNKQRVVYFDARTKVHLERYLAARTDASEALFTALSNPLKRLKINGIEVRLRELGRNLQIERVHPHKFRRTLATRAIDKGMPIEQVQRLLGHQKIDTTLMYAMVDQNNVRESHRRFIS